MKGAWLIEMKYKGTRAVYPPGLSSFWCRRVHHLMVDGECPVIDAKADANVPGGRWDPDFQWPEPPAPPPPVVAPTQDQVNFLAACDQLDRAFTGELAAHVRTHEPEDPVVQAYENLMETLNRGA